MKIKAESGGTYGDMDTTAKYDDNVCSYNDQDRIHLRQYIDLVIDMALECQN